MKKKLFSVKNLTISIEDKTIIDNLSFSLDSESITALLCPNNSGKSLLIKTLSGIVASINGEIILNKTILKKNNYKDYLMHIGVIFEDINNQFLCETVIDEISFPLHNLGYDNFYINNVIRELSNTLNINSILNKKISSLNSVEKVLVLIATSITHKPNILFIDDIFRFFDDKDKKKVFDVLKSINSKYGISILFTTSDLEDVIDVNRIIVINDGKIAFDDSFTNIIMKDNELTKMGFKIPIMIDLSRKLQFYNLLDSICYSPDEVVDKIWK